MRWGAGQGLDAVEPTVPAPHGGSGIVADDPLDVVLVHLPRERPVQRLAQRGRPDRRKLCSGVGLAAAAHMGDLAHEVGPAGMDALRETLEVLDHALVVQVDLREVPLRIGGDVRRPAEHRERDSALGLRLVIPLVALRGHAALGEAAGMAGAHDAVAKGEVLQRERPEQRIVGEHFRAGRGLGHVNGLRCGSEGRRAPGRGEGYGVQPAVVNRRSRCAPGPLSPGNAARVAPLEQPVDEREPSMASEAAKGPMRRIGTMAEVAKTTVFPLGDGAGHAVAHDVRTEHRRAPIVRRALPATERPRPEPGAR